MEDPAFSAHKWQSHLHVPGTAQAMDVGLRRPTGCRGSVTKGGVGVQMSHPKIHQSRSSHHLSHMLRLTK